MSPRLRPRAFLFLLGLGASGVLISCEPGSRQPVEVPVAVQKALRQKFGPHLEQLRWQPDQDRLHASFVWKTIPVDVWLTEAGGVQETRLALVDEDVPPALQDSLGRYYQSYQRQAMHLVETPAGFHYRLLLAAPGGPATRYYFLANGHRLTQPPKASNPTK